MRPRRMSCRALVVIAAALAMVVPRTARADVVFGLSFSIARDIASDGARVVDDPWVN